MTTTQGYPDYQRLSQITQAQIVQQSNTAIAAPSNLGTFYVGAYQDLYVQTFSIGAANTDGKLDFQFFADQAKTMRTGEEIVYCTQGQNVTTSVAVLGNWVQVVVSASAYAAQTYSLTITPLAAVDTASLVPFDAGVILKVNGQAVGAGVTQLLLPVQSGSGPCTLTWTTTLANWVVKAVTLDLNNVEYPIAYQESAAALLGGMMSFQLPSGPAYAYYTNRGAAGAVVNAGWVLGR